MDADPILKLRVEGIIDSGKRARVAFFVALIGAGIVAATLYNDRLAWNWMALDDHHGMDAWTGQPGPRPTDPRDVALAELRTEWDKEQTRLTVQNTEANIGLLGVRIDSADLTIFGSLAMLVLSIYFCLCARRINQDVGFALRETDARTDPGKADAMRYILLGVKQALVLNTQSERNILFMGEADETPVWVARVAGIYGALGYAPAIAVACILVSDITWIVSREPDLTSWLKHVRTLYIVKLAVTESIAAVTLFVVVRLNSLTNRFQTGIARTVVRYDRDR
jgi:hypothetical protein